MSIVKIIRNGAQTAQLISTTAASEGGYDDVRLDPKVRHVP